MENGFGAIDKLQPDHTCDDSYRIDYLRAHIEEMKKAVELDGVDLLGYTRGAASTWCPLPPANYASGTAFYIWARQRRRLPAPGTAIKKKSFDWYKQVRSSQR